MSKSDAWENALLLLLYNNVNAANIGDATGLRGSTTAGQVYVALHSADPGDTGNQSTNEVTTAAYTGYTRMGLNRASGAGGLTVTGNSVSPAGNVDFPASTGGTGVTATHFSIGVAASGAGMILHKGPINPTIAISTGVTPRLTSASAITEE